MLVSLHAREMSTGELVVVHGAVCELAHPLLPRSRVEVAPVSAVANDDGGRARRLMPVLERGGREELQFLAIGQPRLLRDDEPLQPVGCGDGNGGPASPCAVEAVEQALGVPRMRSQLDLWILEVFTVVVE